MNICSECDAILIDENQGLVGIQYDHHHFVCPNPDCEKSPYYKEREKENE